MSIFRMLYKALMSFGIFMRIEYIACEVLKNDL